MRPMTTPVVLNISRGGAKPRAAIELTIRPLIGQQRDPPIGAHHRRREQRRDDEHRQNGAPAAGTAMQIQCDRIGHDQRGKVIDRLTTIELTISST